MGALNPALNDKREVKLTMDQLEVLLSMDSFETKGHFVSAMLPVEEIKKTLSV
ncbi:hypothetical protein ACFQAT_28750 [Undibacterium arcticum]|uniref:hypothetical protein n=1 Tax=Undibacterium arcticum TaxID=1762892 RepID=UPI00360E6506